MRLPPFWNSSSPRTRNKSWRATNSLERMLSGRTPLGVSQNTSPSSPEPLTWNPQSLLTLSPPNTEVRSPTGLFEELLGEPRVLLHDYLERPEAYDYALMPVLTALLSGKKPSELSQEERELLNLSTVIYAEGPKPSSSFKPSPTTYPYPRPSANADKDDEEEIPWIEPDAYDVPFGYIPDAKEGWWKG